MVQDIHPTLSQPAIDFRDLVAPSTAKEADAPGHADAFNEAQFMQACERLLGPVIMRRARWMGMEVARLCELVASLHFLGRLRDADSHCLELVRETHRRLLLGTSAGAGDFA